MVGNFITRTLALMLLTIVWIIEMLIMIPSHIAGMIYEHIYRGFTTGREAPDIIWAALRAESVNNEKEPK